MQDLITYIAVRMSSRQKASHTDTCSRIGLLLSWLASCIYNFRFSCGALCAREVRMINT